MDNKVPRLKRDLPGAVAGGTGFGVGGHPSKYLFGNIWIDLATINAHGDWFEWVTPEPEWTLKSAWEQVYENMTIVYKDNLTQKAVDWINDYAEKMEGNQ